MNRPWQVWLLFAVCAVIVLTTMGWLSGHAIHSDWQRSQAEWSVQREQQISLALWRMDTKLAPLIAEEAARPYRFYDAFFAVKGADGETIEWLPSPLLKPPRNVLLNFENEGTAGWHSPQVPSSEFNQLAIENGISPALIQENRQRLTDLATEVDVATLIKQLPEQEMPVSPHASLAPSLAVPPPDDESMSRQLALPQTKVQQRDYQQRSSRYQGATQQELAKQRSNYANAPLLSTTDGTDAVAEGLSKPLWVKDRLLLARRINRDGQVGVQGSWLDWPNLKQELLTEVADLFPHAELKPLPNPQDGDPARMLAGLRVEFVVPWEKGQWEPATTLHWTLGVGWVALLTALGAVAALMWGVMALSERRAAFVSSVTHELRTPLTTFRMYSDMLARDMVPDPSKRHEYLQTLQREAERLTHLVENVLSYARLERGRRPNANESITVGALIDRQQTRLTERAQQAGMEFQVAMSEAVRDLPLTTDTGVVEQVLFNLVDNAAKYAANADDRRIICQVKVDENWLRLTIRDYGPGFEPHRTTRRPQAFSKTAEEAAVSAPGVGLGLALCRRLAKQLGGRLEIGSGNSGATVALFLPLDRNSGIEIASR